MTFLSFLFTILAVQAPARGETQSGARDRLEVGNSTVRVVAEKRDGVYEERYLAKEGKGWTVVLVNGNPARPDPALKRAGGPARLRFQAAHIDDSGGTRSLVLEARDKEERIIKRIQASEEDPFVHVQVTYAHEDSLELESVLSTYSFRPDNKRYAEYKPLDFVFTPVLRPEPDDVIGEHAFRSPALMMQKGSRFAALIPDITTFDEKNRPIRTAADVQVEASDAPMISFGLMNWVPRYHVLYSHADTLPLVPLPKGEVGYGYFIYVSATAETRRGFQEVVRFEWSRFGHGYFLRATNPQAEPFSSYIAKAWDQYVPKIAIDANYRDVPVTLLPSFRLAWSNNLPKGADNDNWFNVWFNSLRTAYGMYLYGLETGSERLKRQGLGNLNLALLAPQKGGIAPSIFYLDSTGGHWVNDHGWGGIDSGKDYAMFHNAWTNVWLLQWSALVPERREEILSYVGAFADFLIKHQQPSGVIPSWYRPENLEPAPELRDENGETAGAALLLAEYYRHSKQKKYLDAAEKAMNYIFTAILPERKWFDYETFFSCSRKPLGFFDRYTQQHPQNTLSIHQATEACYTLFELTGKEIYKTHGTEILDYLCLYQQVWSPRWLSCELLGGFGVQNTDGEWSDSRQGYFAVTLVKYYQLTGRREYFERGVAALRAMFSLFESPDSPRTAENYAHSSIDHIAGVTGLHWGTGSSVVSFHLIRQNYGDAYVNIKDQWGAGIDGCRIPSVAVRGAEIRLELLDNVNSPRQVKLVFGKGARKKYQIVVNGVKMGSFTAQQLAQGINVAL